MNNFSPLELTVMAGSIVLLILLCCFLLARGVKKCQHPFDVEPDVQAKKEATEIPVFLERPWPPETEWFSHKNYYPQIAGQYKVRRKYRHKGKARFFGSEYMALNLIWNGEKWLNSDGGECYFQDWEFQGLTEKVTA